MTGTSLRSFHPWAARWKNGAREQKMFWYCRQAFVGSATSAVSYKVYCIFCWWCSSPEDFPTPGSACHNPRWYFPQCLLFLRTDGAGYHAPSLPLFCSAPWRSQLSWLRAFIPPPSQPFPGGAWQLFISWLVLFFDIFSLVCGRGKLSTCSLTLQGTETWNKC